MEFPHTEAGIEYVLARIIQDFMQFMHETGLSRPQIHALLHIFHAGEHVLDARLRMLCLHLTLSILHS